MTIESLAPSTSAPNNIRDNQPQMPSFLTGTFTGDDTDFHDYIADGRGKGRLTVAFYTTGTSTYTVSVYGQHSSGTTAGGVGSFFIGSFAAYSSGAGSTEGGYETIADPFPFYMARVQTSSTGDASGPVNTLYLNFSAY